MHHKPQGQLSLISRDILWNIKITLGYSLQFYDHWLIHNHYYPKYLNGFFLRSTTKFLREDTYNQKWITRIMLT